MKNELENTGLRLQADKIGDALSLHLASKLGDWDIADGETVYRIAKHTDEGLLISEGLSDVGVEVSDGEMRITGDIRGLRVEHILELPQGQCYMNEQISVRNVSDNRISLHDLSIAFTKRVSNEVARVLDGCAEDRFVAVPFKHYPVDPADFDVDFSIADLIHNPGRERRAGSNPRHFPEFGHYPSSRWASEGWAWSHMGQAIGVFKFNQDAMEFSILSLELRDQGIDVCFGGAGMYAGDPSFLENIDPGQTAQFGTTRYQIEVGEAKQAFYAYRTFLDENGCRFPLDYDPPVHWNELYDNAEWHLMTPGHPPGRRKTRAATYTKELVLEEARKAVEYGCESLYLDPGWDTDFATFLWGKEWLGPRGQFVQEVRDRYGLGVSLHCPLATWMSFDGRSIDSWPRESWQMDAQGKFREGCVCLGSKQYLDMAADRLLSNCRDGVSFLMFDGNWWNGGCWNPDHGHPVPYTKEDHVRANLSLAQRVHERFPDVLIEMHDMVAGGAQWRYTPVYYKYGLPGSYDENWGFELMWQPIEDIQSGRALALYYYNMACNVPIYLHVDLREDNAHCLVLWWYTSTCRHLGIGGTHPDHGVRSSHKEAMGVYRSLADYYKRGEFIGVSEEVHIHMLPDKNAFACNVFNLSDQLRWIDQCIDLTDFGLDPDRWYEMPKGSRFDRDSGAFMIHTKLEPWGTRVFEVKPWS